MIKLRSKRLFRSSSKLSTGGATHGDGGAAIKGCKVNGGEIKWELRPGGMLVQKRDYKASDNEVMITIKVSTVSQWHDISVQATSTFGELKIILSILTNLEPKEQRLLFKGKEREDNEYLHMVGVRDKDKVLMLEDPAIKERKLVGLSGRQVIGSPYRTITV
ncbi:BAG family molecular chaperone regulator 2-like [Olea europaea subsp. europaea]|uniref:BAG family molecular chaperone regulator 2-like n=1 Tax=Olea europaea subsp. europaea TaxID=158383 RepID=A0A8S0S982_OLEEU|nr:BAG family molecular chaperone regulator 2-like [Olea europaea subsp. europaea]